MDDLSKYIKKELSVILKHAKITTPKKCHSMAKIKSIIQRSPIQKSQKKNINKSIKQIQSVISLKALTSKQKKDPKIVFSSTKNPYKKQLFYQKMLLDQIAIEKRYSGSNNYTNIKRHDQTDSHKSQNQGTKNMLKQESFNYLLQKYEQAKTLRLKRQDYLSQLMIKAQRMNRLLQIKRQNEQKYLSSRMLSQEYAKKKKQMLKIERQVKTASSSNNRKTVHSLVEKYNLYLN